MSFLFLKLELQYTGPGDELSLPIVTLIYVV